LDEEKSKHARLAQQNGFGTTFLHSTNIEEAGKRHNKA
jgi:hypothetical protein